MDAGEVLVVELVCGFWAVGELHWDLVVLVRVRIQGNEQDFWSFTRSRPSAATDFVVDEASAIFWVGAGIRCDHACMG